MRFRRPILASAAISVLLAAPAHATFHLMQIEQVIGGVDGDTQAQAVQLRMRAAGQSLVSNARLVVHDAAGMNPVLIIAFPSDVANGAAGARVLVATPGFATMSNPAVTPDFPMTNPIPDSYLAAGSLTYEDNFGDVYWRLSWGGSAYTGPGTGLTTNDADGNFDPPFAGPLPSATEQALLFQGTFSALSTNNAANYALTPGSATFTNNLGQTGITLGVEDGAAPGAIALSVPAPDPVRGTMRYSIELPRAAGVQVRVLDVAGRTVATLANGTLSAGRHSFTWNAIQSGGSQLASGLYLLELSVAGERQTRRFVLVR